MTTTTLSPGVYGSQTIAADETLTSSGGPSAVTITSAAITNQETEYVGVSNAQIGDLSGDGFTISATGVGGVAVEILGSNDALEGNMLSANGGEGADVVTGLGANNLTIESNNFEGVGFALAYVNGALDGYTPSTNVNFINNTFSGTATAGADISDDAASGTISGNTFSGSGGEAIFLGNVSTAIANYYNNLYGTTYTPVPGTITVSGNNFSGWTGADVSTWDANYTFAHGGAGVALTDTVTTSGQEIDTITGWTGGTITLDAGFDTALYAIQNGKNEVDVHLSNGDEIIIQGTNVSASTIGAMLGAPGVQGTVQIGSYTIGLVGNENDLVLIGSHDAVLVGSGSDYVSLGSYDLIGVGNGNDTISVGTNDVVAIGNGTDLITSGVGGNISYDAITIGNGPDDFLHGAGNINNSLIVFGSGAEDHMTADNGISNDIIIFGNGAEDSVITAVPPGDGGSITDSTVTLGNGAGDFVAANVDLTGDTITLGDGAGDHVDAFDSVDNSTITFHDVTGNTSGDSVIALNDVSGSTISFGNSAGDSVLALGILTDDAITFGNGKGDSVTGGDGGGNTITLGNGNNDNVSLTGSSPGGDYIATGTGSGDTVTVGTHTNPDTFAFALGTNGTNYTTVNGAASGDELVVPGNQLGNTLAVNESTTDTTLASFISSLGQLTKGHTYVGYNTTANETFVVTDSSSGQTGATELTESFHNSVLANHILHLA